MITASNVGSGVASNNALCALNLQFELSMMSKRMLHLEKQKQQLEVEQQQTQDSNQQLQDLVAQLQSQLQQLKHQPSTDNSIRAMQVGLVLHKSLPLWQCDTS